MVLTANESWPFARRLASITTSPWLQKTCQFRSIWSEKNWKTWTTRIRITSQISWKLWLFNRIVLYLVRANFLKFFPTFILFPTYDDDFSVSWPSFTARQAPALSTRLRPLPNSSEIFIPSRASSSMRCRASEQFLSTSETLITSSHRPTSVSKAFPDLPTPSAERTNWICAKVWIILVKPKTVIRSRSSKAWVLSGLSRGCLKQICSIPSSSIQP